MSVLSERLATIKPSPINAIYTLALQLREAGQDIIDLSIGEPDFDTPEHVKQAAWRAIQAGFTKYTNIDGTTELKQAVQAKFRRDNNLDYGLDQISIGAGVKPILFQVFQASLNPSDEVIIPAPCWTSYPDMVRLTGGKPVILPCPAEHGFKLQPDDLEQAITPHSKWLLLNAPGNPSGTAYNQSELKALTAVLLQHPQLWVLSDDIYEHMLYDGLAFVTPAQVEPRLFERTVTLNGVSKAYAMTGWRIGYAGAPVEIIQAMRKILSQSNSNPCSISQAAAVEALNGPQDLLQERADIFRQRRDLVLSLLEPVPGLRCNRPQGAFYLYINCGQVLGKTTPQGGRLASSTDVVTYLLETQGLALVPGSAFEYEPYFRLSYAASTEVLTEACRRIRLACEHLQ